MNAKKCKELRRKALEQSVGLSARGLMWAKAKCRGGRTVTQGYLVNQSFTTRGIYRQLKREAQS